jgi:hypothetical protein
MRELRDTNVPPPLSNWNACTIANICRNEFYVTGVWYYNKRASTVPQKIRNPHKERPRKNTSHALRPREEWVALGGAHHVEPVISPELFALAGAQLARNVNILSGQPSDRYILTGLVRCGYELLSEPKICGRRFSGHLFKGTLRYACSNRDRATGESQCCARSVLAAPLEQCVWDAAMETLGDEKTLRANIEVHLAGQRETISEAEVERLKARIAELRRIEFKARSEELRAPDFEAAQFYRQAIHEAVRDRRALEADLAALIGKGALGEVNISDIVEAVQRARKCRPAEQRAERKALLRDVVDSVVYADGMAEIVLKIPLNCKVQQPAAGAFRLGPRANGFAASGRRKRQPDCGASSDGKRATGHWRRNRRTRGGIWRGPVANSVGVPQRAFSPHLPGALAYCVGLHVRSGAFDGDYLRSSARLVCD